MSAGFITLTFGWIWLLIAWTLFGAPLFALLMILRIALDRGPARRWAWFGLLCCVVAMIALWFLLDQGDSYGTPATIVVLGALTAGALSWLQSARTTATARIWADLVVVTLPTVIGIWLWIIE